MVKAVFFDYDGVLTTDSTGSLTTNRYLSQAAGIDISRIETALSLYSRDLTLGNTTYARIWPQFCGELGRDLSIDMLYEAFESTPVNAGMFSLARALKEDYFVGIITDNKKERIDHLKKTQDLGTLFRPIVVSAEVGASKESAEIFLHALNRTSVSAEESIFIDNNRDNLVAPRALGFRTIFHDDATNDIAALVGALKTLGVVAGNA